MQMVRAIGKKDDSTARTRSEFTPRTATKMLPLVKQIVRDIDRLTKSIAGQREQLRVIDQLPETIEHRDYSEEISDIRLSLVVEEKRLIQCLAELTALGLKPHTPFDGTVDFPAVINRRRVELCWHQEDERVEYWHEIGQTKADRKKIDPNKFGSESLN